MKAYETLKADGISIRVIDLYSVKPIDAKTVLDAAAATNNTLVTVEDHYPEGGLNDAVMDAVAPSGVTVHKLAVNGLPRSGKADELLEAHGISAGTIVRKVREIL